MLMPSEVTMSDYFCGAGGSSTGAIQVPGVRVNMAVNHWPLAIETHNMNHQTTDHDIADMSVVDPARYQHSTIGWFSPECTYWSQARGDKLPTNQLEFDLFGDRLPDEAADRSRMGMWDVVRFSNHHRYEIVIVENVPRVVKGAHWNAWLDAMHKLGYLHEVIWQNSMHAQALGRPAPQSRDRVYITFWKVGNRRPDFDKWLRPKAVCPEHGLVRSMQFFKPKGSAMKMYGTQYTLRCPHISCRHAEVFPAVLGAESVIDWSLRGIRIADRPKHGLEPLAEKTMLRTFAGARKHWLPLIVEAAGNQYDAADPRHPQHGDLDSYYRAWSTKDPLRTLHTTVSKALITNHFSGSDVSRSQGVDDPLPTLVASGSHQSILVPVEGRDGASPARSVDDPLRTQSTRNETAIATPRPIMVPYSRTSVAHGVEEPLTTLRTHESQAMLVPAGGTWRDSATSVKDPMPTRTGSQSDAVVIPLRNHGVAKSVAEPIDTVSAGGNHHALVMRNNGEGDTGWQLKPVQEPLATLTTAGHQSLVEPTDLELYALTEQALWEMVMDAEFRMLEPPEIKGGMGFDQSYILLGNKREQVRLAGNAVTPNVARDLIAACVESLGYELELAA